METRDPIEKLRSCLLCIPCDGHICYSYESADEIADKIEAAYMQLPVDADGVSASIELNDRGFAYVVNRLHGCDVTTMCTPEEVVHVKPDTEAVGNIVHVSREDWDDMSDAMDKLRAERDRLSEGLRCMTVERDFWRKRCRSQDETIGGLADKLADEGMA